nr:putative carbohydrate binding domain containing protein [uncultured Mediterranean phage uvMED]
MSRARDFADLAGAADAGGITGKNMVVNGSMAVAQRSTSETGQGASSGYTTLDRFRHEMGGDATAGRFTISQNSVTDLSGFSKSLKIQCTTADTSTAASEGLLVQQRFEGQNLQRLMSTSTSTKAFTLSFYAKQNETRNIVVEIRTSQGTNRQICKLFAVTSSWARYEFTVPAQASGMTINDDNSNELQLNFWLHGGSTFTGGTLDTSFAGSTNANRAVGVGSIFASTSNFIEITGVQLEVGSVATDFDHSESHGETLAKCQRYYETSFDSAPSTTNTSNNGLIASGGIAGDTTTSFSPEAAATYKVSKRAVPSVTFYDLATPRNTGKCHRFQLGAQAHDNSAVTIADSGITRFNAFSGNGNACSGIAFHYEADAEL